MVDIFLFYHQSISITFAKVFETHHSELHLIKFVLILKKLTIQSDFSISRPETVLRLAAVLAQVFV